MSGMSSINNIFEFAPSVHLLRLEPNAKIPLKGSQWRKHPLAMDDAIKWIEAGNRLGIVPASAKTGVVDIDTGGQDSLDFVRTKLGDPVELVETASHTADNPRWHCIYAHNPSTHIGNAKWQGGDLRVDSGYVVIWDIDKWANAIATIAVQEIPPADIASLKNARIPSPGDSLIIGQSFNITNGLHPQTLAELGAAIQSSETWEECKDKCTEIIDQHCKARMARDGDTRATKEKLRNEVESWEKAIPKWWKEKKSKSPSVKNNIRLTTKQDHPSQAMVEGLTQCGYQFRTMLYGMRPTYKHKDQADNAWTALTDGNHATLMIEMGNRCHWEVEKKDRIEKRSLVVPVAREKQAIRSLSDRDIYDPIKVYLDNLPKWSPTMPSRIYTFMEDSELTLESEQRIAEGKTIDVSDWAQSYFFIEIVRCTYYPGAQRMPILVLRGKGGEGKSSIGKMVLVNEWRKALFSDKFRLSLDDQKRAMICIRNKVLEVPEFGVYRKGDWDEIKASVFEDNAEARLPYGEHITEVPRHDVMYITTNKANLPEDDPAIHRRFIYVNLKGKAKRQNKIAYYHLDEIIDGYTLRDWLFAEAKYRIEQSPDPANYCNLPEDMEPEEWMTFNKMQGGTFATPGTSFQQSVGDVIDELIDDDRRFVSLAEMRLLVALNRSGLSIRASAEMEHKIDAQNITNAKIENAVKADAMNRSDSYYKVGRELGTDQKGPRGFNLKGCE